MSTADADRPQQRWTCQLLPGSVLVSHPLLLKLASLLLVSGASLHFAFYTWPPPPQKEENLKWPTGPGPKWLLWKMSILTCIGLPLALSLQLQLQDLKWSGTLWSATSAQASSVGRYDILFSCLVTPVTLTHIHACTYTHNYQLPKHINPFNNYVQEYMVQHAPRTHIAISWQSQSSNFYTNIHTHTMHRRA